MQNAQAANRTAHLPHQLRHALAENWWLVLLKGIAAVLFGVLAMIWPGITLMTLVLLFGAFALFDGTLAIIAAIRGGSASFWWLTIVGLLGIAAGVTTLLWPGITGLILLVSIAIWAVSTGIMQIVGAIRLRDAIDGEWLLLSSGALSVLFGLVILVQPRAGVLALAWIIAAYAILYGVVLSLMAFRLRGHVGFETH